MKNFRYTPEEGTARRGRSFTGPIARCLDFMLAEAGAGPDEHEVAYNFRLPVDYQAMLIAWRDRTDFVEWEIDVLGRAENGQRLYRVWSGRDSWTAPPAPSAALVEAERRATEMEQLAVKARILWAQASATAADVWEQVVEAEQMAKDARAAARGEA